jgi:hypothetical protein
VLRHGEPTLPSFRFHMWAEIFFCVPDIEEIIAASTHLWDALCREKSAAKTTLQALLV